MLTNLVWSIVMPSSWLLITIGFALYQLHRGRIKQTKYILVTWVILVALISIIPLGDLLLSPLENFYPLKPEVNNPRAIILLGGSEDVIQSSATGLSHLNTHATRYVTTIKLANTYPDAKVIVSGGVGHLPQSSLTEAFVSKDILLTAGIDEKRIILEDQSHSTIENAIFTKKIVDDLDVATIDDPVILVTTAAHMPRSMGLFCGVGFRSIVPYPTSFMSKKTIDRIFIDLPGHLSQLNFAVHEWIGLIINWITGRSDFLVTAC